MRVEAEGWEYRETRSRGRGGFLREYLPPPAILALIEKRLQGKESQEAPAPDPAPGTASVLKVEEPPPARYTAAPEGCHEIDVKALAAILRGTLESLGPRATPEKVARIAAEFYAKVTREGLPAKGRTGSGGEPAA